MLKVGKKDEKENEKVKKRKKIDDESKCSHTYLTKYDQVKNTIKLLRTKVN